MPNRNSVNIIFLFSLTIFPFRYISVTEMMTIRFGIKNEFEVLYTQVHFQIINTKEILKSLVLLRLCTFYTHLISSIRVMMLWKKKKEAIS